MKGLYQYVREEWKNPSKSLGKAFMIKRLAEWRKQSAIHRVEHPTRIDKARALGFKAKQGYIVVRARVKKGVTKRPKPRMGRKPRRYAFAKLSSRKSKQRIAEERVASHYRGLEVLNSYYVGEDGKQKWFEVILVDPNHPVIKADKNINWISSNKNRNRAGRGLTSAGHKTRGLRK